MHFIVEFPFPDHEYRREIWRVAFPREAPLADDANFGVLAREIKLPMKRPYRRDRRLRARLRYARLRHQAAIEDVDYRAARGLDRALFQKLADGSWIDAHDNLILCGPTGRVT